MTAPSTQQVGADARLAKLIGEINRRIPTEEFSLDLLVDQVGQSDLSVRELCADIKTRLSCLDVEALLFRGEEPAWCWSKGGWQLDFTARPLAREHRRDGGRIIGSHGPGVHLIDEADPMLKALKNKASRYGTDLGRPYLIAIDADGYPDYHDIHQVLFGPFELSMQQPTAGVTSAAWVRRSDGLWRDVDGWARRHVSAVLTFDNLWPWSVAKSVPTMWLHPSAQYPLPSVPQLAIAAHLPSGATEIQYRPVGLPPYRFFSLEEGWPHFGAGTAARAPSPQQPC